MNSKKNDIISFNQQHLKKFLLSHSAIRINDIESNFNLPEKTLEQFLKGEKELSLKDFKKLEEILYDYGYKSLDSE